MLRILPATINGVFVWLLLLWPLRGHAHSPLNVREQDPIPLVIGATLLAVFWLAYTLGAWRVPRGWKRAWAFHGAAGAAAFTLFGPLDAWAETSAAMHMTQHMAMMVVIAPLWVLSQPLPQVAAAAGRVAVWLSRPWLQLAAYPLLAACLHALVIWFWHAPKLYVLALENAWWHAVEHLCFLLTAGIFWWAVLHSSQCRAAHALLALLFTLMHTGLLGALLTFAAAPLYGEGRDLHSQQLAGMLMWVLGGVPYMAAAAWCGMRWFQQIMRRASAGQPG